MPTPSGSIAHTLRDYRRAGVDKPRRGARAAQADRRGADASSASSSRRTSPRTCARSRSRTRRGSPACRPTSSRRTRPTPNGTIRITTDYPDYNPFMTYATDDELRQRALHRVPQPRRSARTRRVLRDILTLRAEKAALLGFADWADYITADKMIAAAASAARVHREGVEARRAARRAGLRRAARASSSTIDADGDRRSPTGRRSGSRTWSRSERYEVDASEVRQYFPYDAGARGLLEITCADLRPHVRRRSPTPRPWHPSVHVFDVMRGGDQARPHLPRHASARGQVQARGAVPAQGRRARRAAPRGRARLQLPAAERRGSRR